MPVKTLQEGCLPSFYASLALFSNIPKEQIDPLIVYWGSFYRIVLSN